MATPTEASSFTGERNGAYSKEGGLPINPQIGAMRMTTDSQVPTLSTRASESTTAQGILGAAMVGVLGRDPRLAMRAARVVLKDSYGSRHSRRGRLRGHTRQHGD